MVCATAEPAAPWLDGPAAAPVLAHLRYRGDVVEISGRYRGDVVEISGRYGGDIAAAPVIAHLRYRGDIGEI